MRNLSAASLQTGTYMHSLFAVPNHGRFLVLHMGVRTGNRCKCNESSSWCPVFERNSNGCSPNRHDSSNVSIMAGGHGASASNRIRNISPVSGLNTVSAGGRTLPGGPVWYTSCPRQRLISCATRAAQSKSVFRRRRNRSAQNASDQGLIRRRFDRARMASKLASMASAKAVADNDVDSIRISLVVSSGNNIRAL